MTSPRAERALDLILGSVLLLAASPLMSLCALLVAVGSGLPILYRQPRAGRGGTPFEILKFRTMVQGADGMQWPPASPEQTPEAGMRRRDPRVTVVGRLLRRWGLDELPQLVNVLRGDMSLVGPRPLPLAERARLAERVGSESPAQARPGLTGPYQVALRRGLSFEGALQVESAYLRQHGGRQYLALLLATPLALLRGGGDLLRMPQQATVLGSSQAAVGHDRENPPATAIEALRRLSCLHVLGRTLLFDPVTARAFSIDGVAAGALQKSQEASPASLPAGLTVPEREAWAELLSLGQWLMAAGTATQRPHPGVETPSECRLLLEITRACTLRCAYCYCADAARDGRPPEHMSWEVATAAVGLLVKLVNDWECPGFLNFTGGEPLLRFGFLAQLVEHTAAVAQREAVDLEWSFGITNGTVSPLGLVEYLQRTSHVISVSLDGPESLHDANRSFPHGDGSHAKAATLARDLLAAGVAKSAGATVTANNPYPRAILEYLMSLGFERVVIKPARLPRGHRLALTESNLQPLLDGYEELARLLVEYACAGRVGHMLAVLNPLDYFGRFVMRIACGERVEYRCPAARSSFGVSTSGGVYPCSSLCDIPGFLVGSVSAGIDWDRCREFLAPPVAERASCAGCWARHLCGGGCAYAGYVTNGSVLEPDGAECELTRHLCRLGLWLWAELTERSPQAAAVARRHVKQLADGPRKVTSQPEAARRPSDGRGNQD